MHRPVCEISLEILREVGYRSITALRLVVESLPHNMVQVALQASGRRELAGQQLVQHHAEREDVDGGSNRLATHLLRARISGRHGPRAYGGVPRLGGEFG